MQAYYGMCAVVADLALARVPPLTTLPLYPAFWLTGGRATMVAVLPCVLLVIFAAFGGVWRPLYRPDLFLLQFGGNLGGRCAVRILNSCGGILGSISGGSFSCLWHLAVAPMAVGSQSPNNISHKDRCSIVMLCVRRCGVAALRCCGRAGVRACGRAGLRVCGLAGVRACGLA